MYISVSPVPSPIHTMYLPSGLQSALRSLDAGVRLRLRVTPLPTGMSNTSPRAVANILLPSGERAALLMRLPTGRLSILAWVLSELRVTGTLTQLRPLGSNRYIQPPFSNTMVCPSVLGNLMSYSLKSVTFSVLPFFTL